MPKYPSVTQILSPWLDFSRIPEARLAAAAERGRETHKICASIAQGLWAPCPKELEGYVKSFRNWFESAVVEVHAVECELVDEINGFIGHVDAILSIKGDSLPSIVDWKTPATQSRTWIAQISSYAHLAETDPKSPVKKIGRIGAVQLDPHGGTAKIREYTAERYRGLQAFMNALGAYRYFREE